eukprot:2254103-Heterocapsa_arctica.AAC.1
MLPTTWRHINGGKVKLDAARMGQAVCPPCVVPQGARVRARDDDDEGKDERRAKGPRHSLQPHFELPRRPSVSRFRPRPAGPGPESAHK